MSLFVVHEDRCTRCGLCIADCPSRIIGDRGDGVPAVAPEVEGQCLRCQHCLAICPGGAVSVAGVNPDLSQPLDDGVWPALAQMDRLLRGRRTVRHYRAENVAAEQIDALLAAVAHAPSGVNTRRLSFHVIRERGVMAQLRERALRELAAARAERRIPESFGYLLAAPEAYAEQGFDLIFRGAPHALIVAAKRGALCPVEDAIIALAQFDLLAQSAGLGTVWWGMLKMMLEVLPDLKADLGLPRDTPYYYGMLFGLPAVRYVRTVQRDRASIRTVRLPT